MVVLRGDFPVKIIKSRKRCSLGEDKLDNLVRNCQETPSAEKWDTTSAVKLWWTDKTRRVNHPATSTKTCKAQKLQEAEHKKKG